MVDALGLEPRLFANRANVLAAGRSIYGAPVENRTRPSALPKLRAASNASGANMEPGAELESASLIYKTSTSPYMLTRQNGAG